MKIEWRSHDLQLLPERAAWMESRQTLLLADLHLGKAEAFLRHGICLPTGPTERTLERMRQLVARIEPRRVIILGDLAHTPVSNPDAFDAFGRCCATIRQSESTRDVEIMLVRGNHDRGRLPPALSVIEVDEICEDGIVFTHHPEHVDGMGVMCGHVHPAVVVGGRKNSISAPCFACDDQMFILPAFGEFTGCASISPESGMRMFAVGDGQVIELPTVRV